LVASNDPADDRAIDAFVAFHDGLNREVDRNPALRVPEWLASLAGRGDRWRAARPDTDAVTVTSVAAAAGRQWHTVVVAGAVEGEFPAVDGHAPLFEPAVLAGGSAPTAAERRRESLAEERRLFCEVATTRAATTWPATGPRSRRRGATTSTCSSAGGKRRARPFAPTSSPSSGTSKSTSGPTRSSAASIAWIAATAA